MTDLRPAEGQSEGEGQLKKCPTSKSNLSVPFSWLLFLLVDMIVSCKMVVVVGETFFYKSFSV